MWYGLSLVTFYNYKTCDFVDQLAIGESLIGSWGVFWWPLPLWRGGCCREVKIIVDAWNVCWEDHCSEMAVSRGLTLKIVLKMEWWWAMQIFKLLNAYWVLSFIVYTCPFYPSLLFQPPSCSQSVKWAVSYLSGLSGRFRLAVHKFLCLFFLFFFNTVVI